MKLEITEPSAFDKDGKELEVGSIITVKGDDVPGYLVGKCREVTVAGAKGKTAVTNPAGGALPGDDTATGGAV
jgi:hypothetical protein